jgi:hypothetical protein
VAKITLMGLIGYFAAPAWGATIKIVATTMAHSHKIPFLVNILPSSQVK